MQCLYCDAELKAFRGLFDEDFCCREHRDKYFSSFRKALNRLPEILSGADSVPLALRQPEALSSSPDFPKVAGALNGPPNTEVHAFVENAPPSAQPTPPAEIPAETFDPPPPTAIYTAGEAADSPAVDPDEIAFGPPAADLLPVAVAAMACVQPPRSNSLDVFPVSYAIEFPAGLTTWSAALERDERPANLLDPPETTAAAAFAPIPTPLELSAENPALSAAAPALPESSESAAHAPFQLASGYASLWNHADPLAPAPLALALAPFAPPADGAACMPSAEFAEVALTSQPLAGSAIAAAEMPLVHEFRAPEFTPSAQSTLTDEERDEIQTDADWAEADSPAPSEIAPALVMNSAPLDSPALMPARAAQMMPPALSLSSAAAPLHTPGLASTIEGQPALAPELMAEIPQSPAANPPAEPRSHAPLRHFFGSSVRIKNWRLRITFAKPA